MKQSDLSQLATNGWRLTPATCAQRISGGSWIPARHLLYIALKIALGIRRGGARLIVSVPPRHGKSELISINTPIWHLNEWQDKFVMLTSYGADLAGDFGRKVRDHIAANETGDLTVKLRQDSQQVSRFHTQGVGGMFSVGLGGPILGRGAHLLLVDDYIKNAEHAQSPTQREKDYQWLRSTAMSRMEPGGSVIIVATRWDVDDIIGRLLVDLKDVFEYVRLPALAEDDDPLGRSVGEALWPGRYNEQALADIKELVGTYWWEAEYQQAPLASMAGIVRGDMIQEVDVLPHYKFLRILRSWDLAATQDGGDWSVGIKYAKHVNKDEYYILDIIRRQVHADAVEKLLADTVKLDAESEHVPEQIVVEREPGSAGKILEAHLRKTVFKGWPCDFQPVSGKLEVRASPFMAAIERGAVKSLRAPWLELFKTEINRFPIGDHDDQISAGAHAHNKLSGAKKRVVWGEDASSRGTSNVARREAGIGHNSGRIITGVTF